MAEKDYETDAAIHSVWQEVRRAFKNAFMVTFFGYGAPVSDGAAVELLRDAWGEWRERDLEQIEFIDIRQKDDLLETWRRFIHTHHYEVHADFYDSWLAHHPRRTGEAYISQCLDARFIGDNPLPRTAGFEGLWAWFQPLIAAEARAHEANERDRHAPRRDK